MTIYRSLYSDVQKLITESLAEQVNDYDTDSKQFDSSAKVANWHQDVISLALSISESRAVDDVCALTPDPVDRNEIALRVNHSKTRFAKEIRAFKTMFELRDKNEEAAEIINKIKQILDDRLSVCIKDLDDNILLIKEKIKNVDSPWGTAGQVLEEYLDSLVSEAEQNTEKRYKVYFTVPEHNPSVMTAKVLFKRTPYQKICEGEVFEEGILPYQYDLSVPKEVQWKDSPLKQQS